MSRTFYLGLALAAALAAPASPARASTPTLTLTRDFQQGVDGYEGTTQLRLRANGLVENGADIAQYYLDGSPFANQADDTVDVIRFDSVFGTGPGQIPVGATILDAQLVYTTGDAADAMTGGPYQLGRLTSEVPSYATYNDYPLDPPERRSTRSLTAEPWLAAVAAVQVSEVLPIDITEIVQAWSDGAPNHGITVFANDTTDGWQICSISHADLAKRPRLSVTFTTQPVQHRTFAPSATSLLLATGTTQDAGTEATATLSTAATGPVGLLFRFDTVFGEATDKIGARDQILRAKLVLQTAGAPDYSAAADSASPFTVHQILAPWGSVDFGTNGLTVAEGDIAEATDELVGLGEWTRATAEVTSAVSNWKAGQPNHGIHLKPGGGNGWQLFLSSATNTAWQPTLHVWSFLSSGAPSASIKTDATQGEAPLTVRFDASASIDPEGQPLRFEWNFGDQQTATEPTPTHTFTNAGVYPVALTVTDAEGKTAEAVINIRVLGNPVPKLTTTLLRGPEPHRLTVSAAGSLDPDGGSIRYRWSFGDGTESSAESVNHTYTRGGTFPLVLTVTDDEGLSVAVTNTVRVFETTVQTTRFQEGIDGYAGTFERRVLANGTGQMGREVTQYYLDGRPQTSDQAINDTCELIRFDAIVGAGNGQIPPKATIVRATLTYHSGNDVNANADGPYVVGFLTKPVSETTTYEELDSGTGVNEERGPRGSVEPLLLAGFADIAVGEVVTADITPFVQRWVNGDANHGLAIFTDDTTDGWQITTIGHPNPDVRPRLQVDYTTNSITRRQFPVTRSIIAAKTALTLDGSLLEMSFLDGGADTDYKEALLGFDPLFGNASGQIPGTEQVLVARLITRTGGLPNSSVDADSDDPYFVHPILVPWDTTSEFGTNGLSIARGMAGPAIAALIGLGERTWSPADVTSLVLDWAEGQPQYGLNIKPGGSDGWQMAWPGHAEPELHPYLEVLAETARATPVEIRITAHRLESSGDLSLTWTSSAGSSYAIEVSEDLRSWTVAVPSVPSQGASTVSSLPRTSSPAHRFFRVRAL